ncbi:hypothetical protein JXA47_04470 [Candidatus Sumerlaeota bacterium]|nr:hypothetical protein [Candidatus Sumerlaeota bacterium]
MGAHGATGRVMLQALLGLAVCALAAMLGSLIGGWRLGLPVGAVLCLDPLMATYSVMLLAEMPLCLLLTAHLIAIALCFQRPTLIRAVLAGGLLGLAILVKPIAVVLSPLAIAACALAPRSPRARMALALICAAALAIAPGLWMARNARVHGTLVLSSISHRLLYFYHGAAAEAWATGRDIEEVQSEWQERYSEVVRSTPDWPSRLHYLQSEALRSVAAHPLAWIRGCTLGLARIAVAPVRAHLQWIMPHSLVSTPLMGLQFILILFLWAGALRAVLRIRRAPRPTAFTIGVALLAALMLITIAAGANANARFRVPAMPALALVGMWGWLCAGRPGASPEDAQRETS